MDEQEQAECGHLAEVAAEVCKVLPGEWTVTEFGEDYCYPVTSVKGPLGAEIHFAVRGPAGRGRRVEVSGFYPRDAGGSAHYPSDPRPSIGMSAEKAPEKAAQDVYRRFWPGYQDAYAEALGSVAGANEYRHRQQANGRRMAEAIGGTYDADTSGRGRQGVINWNHIPGIYGDIQAEGDSVAINFRSLHPDLAEKICRTVREHCEKP